MGPLSIEQILVAEAEAIHDPNDPATQAIIGRLKVLAADQELEGKRAGKDNDIRSGADEERAWVHNRKDFYRELGKLNRGALCLSGGGIRSATFCLGIIQALAQYTLAGKPADKTNPSTPLEGEDRANDSMLSRFHYLSTVSGGGYIGSWLSAWRSRNDFLTVWRNLSSRPEGPDVEAPEVSWLRAYSSYLTPRTGLFSADTWAGIAIYIRNLLLNWLIIIPAIAVVVLVLKIVITFAVGVARIEHWWWPHLLSLLAGIAFLIVAQAFTTRFRPTRRPPTPRAPPRTIPDDPNNIEQLRYLTQDLVFDVGSALMITSTFTSAIGVILVTAVSVWVAVLVGAVLGVLVYAAGWGLGRPSNNSFRDFVRWSLSGAVYGALVGLGAHLFSLMHPYADDSSSIWNLVVPIVLGVPWVMLSQLMADMIFVGLVSYEKDSDSDREWLGRAAGWQAASAVIWILATFITLAGGYFLIEIAGPKLASSVAAAGGVSGIITAWLGKSGSGDLKPKLENPSMSVLAKKMGMALAGPIFAALLVVGISVALDLLLLGDSLLVGLTANTWAYLYIIGWLVLGLAIAYVVALIASRCVNINRFSIHAIYRNRLVRAYLGASRQYRDPDRFTGFDVKDNPKVAQLWPPKASKATGRNTFCLFPVVNITLNVVKATRLAWQQRKAESFTVTPLHCGTFYQGYRKSSEYGGIAKRAGEKPGITLGTAMAISGAAASPNRGYNSSTSTSILLALFNVRLGWWLGNPGEAGNGTYKMEGPRTAIRPLVEETFGLTTDDKPWVYLSDGGHFENLGIYEMVRRRNRFILVVDAGCDGEFKYEDLGNAVRKIYIDLGVRIFIDTLDKLSNRPQPPEDSPYIAVGTIGYNEADGGEAEDGVLLYVKPAYHAVSAREGAGVRSYANESIAFPHESTGDQWFTESQFESYRSLAFDIARTFMKDQAAIGPTDTQKAAAKAAGKPVPPAITLGAMLASLRPTAR